MSRNGKEADHKKAKSQETVNRIIADVSQKGKTLLNEGWENARHVIEENADAFREKAGELSDKSVEELSDEAKHYVRQHPFQSLAMALGLGVLLGFLLKSD